MTDRADELSHENLTGDDLIEGEPVLSDADDPHPDVDTATSALTQLGLAAMALLPGIVFRVGGIDAPAGIRAGVFGLAIIGAAFVLSWAAEASQLDIPSGLSISVVALIAVMPEYAVDAVFALKGGHAFKAAAHGAGGCPSSVAGTESPCALALANMTGGNRLLIGIGWTLVVFIAIYRYKKVRGIKRSGIALERANAVEVAFLGLACAYALTLPLKRTITLLDTAILVSIYIAYTWRIAKGPAEEPHLVGPAAWIGGRTTVQRRATVIALLVLAAGTILLCAEHFAESLVDTGRSAGIDEFLLVQWLAPLASEAPELLVASLAAWRFNATMGLSTLVSSKVNQWTLLVGTLPVAFGFASGSLHGLPIDPAQREELFLTAAQSVFALSVLLNLRVSKREAQVLLALFLGQFTFGAVGPPSFHGPVKISIGALYLLLALGMALRERPRVPVIVRDGFLTPWSELAAGD